MLGFLVWYEREAYFYKTLKRSDWDIGIAVEFELKFLGLFVYREKGVVFVLSAMKASA